MSTPTDAAAAEKLAAEIITPDLLDAMAWDEIARAEQAASVQDCGDMGSILKKAVIDTAVANARIAKISAFIEQAMLEPPAVIESRHVVIGPVPAKEIFPPPAKREWTTAERCTRKLAKELADGIDFGF